MKAKIVKVLSPEEMRSIIMPFYKSNMHNEIKHMVSMIPEMEILIEASMVAGAIAYQEYLTGDLDSFQQIIPN